LKNFNPSDVYNFLFKIRRFSPLSGYFLPRTLLVRWLIWVYLPDSPPENPQDEDVRSKLSRLLPDKNHVQDREYFTSLKTDANTTSGTITPGFDKF
jgi:hypothetical protein